MQELYRRAGYGGVVAFLPEQEASDGVLRIRVVEGRLTRVDISGQQQFSAANIRASLPALQEGTTPDVRRIDAQIQMANESPAKTVQVLLRPGAEPGTVAAQITVAEQPLQQWTLRADNTGSGHTGRLRAALGWQHGNLFDGDQVASLDLQTSPAYPSSVAVLSGAYRSPLYQRALAVDAYGAWSDVDGGKTGTAAGDLQFSGRGFVLGARLSAYLPRPGQHRPAPGHRPGAARLPQCLQHRRPARGCLRLGRGQRLAAAAESGLHRAGRRRHFLECQRWRAGQPGQRWPGMGVRRPLPPCARAAACTMRCCGSTAS